MIRGGIRGGRVPGGPIRPQFKKFFIPRHPFDMILAESSFQKVATAIPANATDDTNLTNVSFIQPSC